MIEIKKIEGGILVILPKKVDAPINMKYLQPGINAIKKVQSLMQSKDHDPETPLITEKVIESIFQSIVLDIQIIDRQSSQDSIKNRNIHYFPDAVSACKFVEDILQNKMPIDIIT